MNPFEPYNCLFSEVERKQLLSESLTELRKGKGLSQKEVAGALGISQATYSTYERGRTEPPMEILVRLSFMYGVSLDIIAQRDRLVKTTAEAQQTLEDLKKQIQEISEAGTQTAEGAALLEVMANLLNATDKLTSTIIDKK